LQKQFGYNDEKMLQVRTILHSNMPIRDNLIDRRHVSGENSNILVITPKGMSTLNNLVNQKSFLYDPWVIALVTLFFGVLVTLALYYGLGIGRNSDSPKVEVRGNITKSLIAPGSINPTLIVNEYNRNPFVKQFEVDIDGLNPPFTEVYGVKYILPHDKEAIVPKLVRGEKYVIFYVNDDFSILEVSDKYKISKNADVKLCWTAEITCDNTDCQSNINFQSQSDTLQELKECYKP